MNEQDDARLSDLFAQSGYRTQVPDALLERVIEGGGQVMAKAMSSRSGASSWRRPKMYQRALAISVASAAILVVGVVLHGRSHSAWADSLETLRNHPWIHFTVNSKGQLVCEAWIGASSGIVAARTDEEIRFDDVHLSESFVFQHSREQLLRVPLDSKRAQLIDGRRLVELLSKPEVTPSEFMAVFLGPSHSNELGEMRQVERAVVDADGSWHEIQCDFAVRPHVGTDRVSATLRVERQTRQLRTVDLAFDLTLPTNGARNKGKIHIAFDYPEDGPRDIFALGVPASAELVDRTPEPAVDTILRRARAVTQRFDDYLCYVIDTPEGCRWYNGRPLYRIWRKENLWRVDIMIVASEPSLFEEEPETQDVHEWWRMRAPKYKYYPAARCDGEFLYRYELEHLKESPTTGLAIKEIAKMPAPPNGEAPLYHGVRPEWWSRALPEIPHAALGHSYQHPAPTGPANTGLLEVQRLGTLTADRYEKLQYWIDTDRNFMTMRCEFHGAAALFDGSKEMEELRKIVITPDMSRGWKSTEVESVAKSPRGYWYPTLIRKRNSEGVGNKTQRFVVNFPKSIDDSIFDPQAPTILESTH